MGECDISFVIPAYNEEKNIQKTIAKIREFVPKQFNYEIIVVDHGSSDRTVAVAEENGASAFVRNGKDITIAGLRNFGVSKSKGEILIFLDADISLTKEWQSNIASVRARLDQGEKLLTGSWYSVPEEPSWIEKHWFEPLQHINNTHINSGHLIISKSHFYRIGGFDESLETGEDYEISMRAKKHDFLVEDNQDLKVIHEGYPKTIKKFLLREFWHGKGDVVSLRSILASKVASVASIFLLLHLTLIFSVLTLSNYDIVFLSLAGIFAICFTLSVVKFHRESISRLIINSAIYYLYFWARAASLIRGVFSKRVHKRQR